jgi:hypothetical protein
MQPVQILKADRPDTLSPGFGFRSKHIGRRYRSCFGRTWPEVAAPEGPLTSSPSIDGLDSRPHR